MKESPENIDLNDELSLDESELSEQSAANNDQRENEQNQTAQSAESLINGVDKKQLTNILSLSDLKLELRVEIAQRKIKVHDLLNIKLEHVIDLKCEVGIPIKVFLNKMLIGYAKVIEMNDRYGIKIVRLINEEERLRFLQYEASK